VLADNSTMGICSISIFNRSGSNPIAGTMGQKLLISGAFVVLAVAVYTILSACLHIRFDNVISKFFGIAKFPLLHFKSVLSLPI